MIASTLGNLMTTQHNCLDTIRWTCSKYIIHEEYPKVFKNKRTQTIKFTNKTEPDLTLQSTQAHSDVLHLAHNFNFAVMKLFGIIANIDKTILI